MLFRGMSALPAVEQEASSPATPATADEYDPVADEIDNWAHLAREHYQAFYAADGLLNEFAMMWALKDRFPLHFVVFKQCASHLPHEANAEQLFSRAGLLSDPNIDPHFLAQLTMMGKNKAVFKPTVKAILDKYYAKYRGNGAASSTEDAILDGWGSLPF